MLDCDWRIQGSEYNWWELPRWVTFMLRCTNLSCIDADTNKDLNSSLNSQGYFAFTHMYTREYQDSEFFSNQLQNIIEFFKNIHSLPAGLSFKLTNQVARFTQLANSSSLWTTLPCSHCWIFLNNSFAFRT